MLEENRRIRFMVPAAVEALIFPLIQHVDNLLHEAVVSICCSSTQIESFVGRVYKALGSLELLVDRIIDILEFRVDAVLRDIATTKLCQIPDDEPVSVQQFLSSTEVISDFLFTSVSVLLKETSMPTLAVYFST